MDPATRPLTLAELLLKFGISLEREDRLAADEARRELSTRFGVTLRLARRRGHPVSSGPRGGER